ELLVRVEACGVCPTDARKYAIGVSDGEYPFNPGHEWVGVVEATGPEADGWAPGDRVYGDTYGGFAELALVPPPPRGWSCGATRVDPAVAAGRAGFLAALAGCPHPGPRQAPGSAGGPGGWVRAAATGPPDPRPRERRRRARAGRGTHRGAAPARAVIRRPAGCQPGGVARRCASIRPRRLRGGDHRNREGRPGFPGNRGCRARRARRRVR